MKYSYDGYYHMLSYDGRSVSYPHNRYNAKAAWKSFYRELRYWKEI